MLALKNRLKKWQHKSVLVMLIGLIWLMSLPTYSVEAAGYYSVKDHNTKLVKPYYNTKQRRIAQTETTTPYYATKNRKHITKTSDDYIDRSKRAGEFIPQELSAGKQQKKSITILKSTGE